MKPYDTFTPFCQSFAIGLLAVLALKFQVISLHSPQPQRWLLVPEWGFIPWDQEFRLLSSNLSAESFQILANFSKSFTMISQTHI